MIRSLKHRGLKPLYEQDDRSGIRADLIETVEDILAGSTKLKRRRP